MAQGVIDALEAVQVHEQHRHDILLATGAGQRLLNAVLQQGAVGQPREIVPAGLAVELTLVGDVGQRHRHTVRELDGERHLIGVHGARELVADPHGRDQRSAHA